MREVEIIITCRGLEEETSVNGAASANCAIFVGVLESTTREVAAIGEDGLVQARDIYS